MRSNNSFLIGFLLGFFGGCCGGGGRLHAWTGTMACRP